MDVLELNSFIVEAKSQTYVAGAKAQPSYRIGAHDLSYKRGIWRYLDSYFGGTDFAGQEVVWLEEKPVWAMNYFGRIIEPEIIDAAIAGTIIRAALSQLYSQGRFLGGMVFDHALGRYVDTSDGDCAHFRGHEFILVNDRKAYELDYRGGFIVA
ncbi:MULTISPECIES: DUF5680 domain-containing protein [unclassified Rhizobium]|uniref:DUF5680 domain-containing protein n=1 Tax=unclassified Rhizobium TaxID=2613769 RepID=UPI00104CBF47|nr:MULTISPECIES: DUF5680 domain-containing protein [unclassified Rhizobium]TCS08442.1 hypothetical protein EV281_101304 [Rhizobium sp. BK418]